MISELVIRNIALISRLSIRFERGFNVLSGETGAGKSILVDSVNLILGSRADRELIRAGEKEAWVEAQLYLTEEQRMLPVMQKYGIESEECIVSRELGAQGRSTCRVNGRLVSLGALREIMASFVDIYGQNQSTRLLEEAYHLQLIDTYAGEAVTEARKAVAAAYLTYRETERTLRELEGNAAEKARRLDLLAYQIAEIERAALQEGEEDALLAEKKIMQNAERIAECLQTARDALSGDRGAVQQLYASAHAMRQIAPLDEAYARVEKALSDAYYAVEDAAYEVAEQADSTRYDPVRLTEVEARLGEISALKRKYGASVEEVLAYLEDCRTQAEQLEHSETRLSALHVALEEQRQTLEEACATLSALRRQYADKLGLRLTGELQELGMKDAVVETHFDRTAYSQGGWDAAALYLSVNRGIPPRPLAKVASGGEMSRIMLAIKNIVTENEPIDTMIFDEIDTGISGTMAQIVAQKIANIARSRQVICVTHLPQLAAMGDANFYIEKHEEDGVVSTHLHRIEAEALEQEIARLSGGLQSAVSRQHARELLSNAQNLKRAMEDF